MTQKVIIFDFDGTIADTLDALVGIANHLAGDFGYAPITTTELAYLRNLSSRQIIKYSGIPLFKIPFLLKKVKSELKGNIKELQPIEGIQQSLIALKEDKYGLGIITSNSTDNVETFLQNNNLENLFDFIYTGATIFGKTTTINKALKQNNLGVTLLVRRGVELRQVLEEVEG